MGNNNNLYTLYSRMSIAQLNQNRSKKVLRLLQISGSKGYFADQERQRIAHQIDSIDAVLASRRNQLKLF